MLNLEKSNMEEDLKPIRSITFDKKAQDDLPQWVKEKMKKDRENAKNKRMGIEYDKDFEKVMSELQANFGWSNIDVLPDNYKDLLNDTIKAVKNCSIPAVVGQSEQLPQKSGHCVSISLEPCKYKGVCKICS